ncbi:M28 family peptidase [Anthocerotibacter panamensis]|uniref:M28 family peptidase n=1 Tax=Anthocerotibacter panamensis TaxID=2857077 RepID=UPI001C4026A8|nr:M28 family peptidase [Anthocerotibacter panamensis]
MVKHRIALLSLAVTLMTGTAQAEAPRTLRAALQTIRAAQIDSYLRFLSSDLLEGRAPATRGGMLAEEYIASTFQQAGLKPGAPDGTWFQPVPINVVTLDPTSYQMTVTGGKTPLPLSYADQAMFWSDRGAGITNLDAEIVFVGYGIRSPENNWDDFKGTDLKGKILVMLVNDPPATKSEPRLFEGRAMTYYGRWTYKFEEAERQGAQACLIIHTPERAGYPWHTVVSSWSGDQRSLPRPASALPPLQARAWITSATAQSLFAAAGLNLGELVVRAGTRTFRPVSTGLRLTGSFSTSQRQFTARNVVARLVGSDLKQQAVVFTAHHDHLGIGPEVKGDRIYNGANDNASGVADLLAMAAAATQAPTPKRSLYFVAVTAEESGLLGSKYFVENPSLPVTDIVANLNIDGGNLLGRTRDIIVQGEFKSTLGDRLREVAQGQGMRTAPDEFPEKGYFYRSDHFSFAQKGIPAASVSAGNDFLDRPEGWGRIEAERYTAQHYHQPSDEYRPDFDLSGAVQLSRLVLQTGLQLANSPTLPQWKPGAEFRRPTTALAPTGQGQIQLR